MELRVDDNLGDLVLKLKNMKAETVRRGKKWADESADLFYEYLHHHLENQGRDESFPPPLSSATVRIYETDGPPDGSGIRDHIERDSMMSGSMYVAYVGIPQGDPTMIANVQNNGAMIEVTDAMRGYMAKKYGISFKKETKYVVVPPRHFWDDSLKKARAKAKKSSEKIMRE